MNGRNVIALDLDGDRLGILGAAVGSQRVTVRTWRVARRPERIDPANAAAVGEWIGEELRKDGASRAGVLLAVHRGEVVLKRINLPRSDAGPAPDLAGMVRLQMARQMTVPMEGTAVDYVQIADEGRVGEEGEASPAGAVTVLAGALPGDRFAWLRAMCEAGEIRIGRIGLRACGAAAVLGEASRGRSGPILGVAPGLASTEFVVVSDGRLVFARGVEVGLPDDPADLEAYAEKIVVEARRTWMSYRVGPASGEVEAVAVIGEGRIAEIVGARCAESLEMPLVRARPPAGVDFAEGLSAESRCLAAPLAGLAGEGLIGEKTLDFANPRRSPDLAARARRRVLLGVLGAILVGGGLYTAASLELSRLAGKLEAARQRQTSLERKYAEHLLQEARLKHIQAWTGPRIDWLAHARWLSAQLPDPREAQLDELSGDMSAGVSFITPDRSYSKGRFTSWQEAELVLTGRVARRDVANEIRARLTASEAYRVDNRGPDVPERFDYALVTQATDPAAAPKARPAQGGAP